MMKPFIQNIKDAKEDLRKCIFICRMHRKAAMIRGDWSAEIFAEKMLNEWRKKYKLLA